MTPTHQVPNDSPAAADARVTGVDGCPAGWIAVTQSADGTTAGALHVSSAALIAATRGDAVVAIDVPIGLTEAGPRACDQMARRLLGARASSVFPAPVRAALGAISYEEACALSAEAHGKRLSRQAFGILPRIRAIDTLLRDDADARARTIEVHPELCFLHWNGGAPMMHAKRTAAGLAERLAIADRDFAGAYEMIRRDHLRSAVANDDILDALAALWTARRIVSGTAVRLPTEPSFDTMGLPMQMLA